MLGAPGLHFAVARELALGDLAGDGVHIVACAATGLRLPQGVGGQAVDLGAPFAEAEFGINLKVGPCRLFQSGAGALRHIHQVQRREDEFQRRQVLGQFGFHPGSDQCIRGLLPTGLRGSGQPVGQVGAHFAGRRLVALDQRGQVRALGADAQHPA